MPAGSRGFGMTGARITTTLLNGLRERDGQHAAGSRVRSGGARVSERVPSARLDVVHVEPLAGSTLGSAGDDFVLVQWTAEVGDRWIAPLHVHHRDDEAWYVLSGTLGFRLGDDEIHANAGSAVLARRGTPHTYWNAGKTEAEYLLVMPPRIAQLIDEIHRPDADVAAVFVAYASEIVRTA